MTDEERREMTRNNYYALMRASYCDKDGNPDPDFVRVVRCQDCRFGVLAKNGYGEDIVICENPDPPSIEKFVIMPGWYCADGERRE